MSVKWEVIKYHLTEVVKLCNDKMKCAEVDKFVRKALSEVEIQNKKKDRVLASEQMKEKAKQNNSNWQKSLQEGFDKILLEKLKKEDSESLERNKNEQSN